MARKSSQQNGRLLVIDDLKVEVKGKEILRHVDLAIDKGETHALFGPNGSGKTTLLMAIMGFPAYQVTGGKIVFKGQDITALPLNERAEMGIGLSFQRPPTIRGVKTRQMLEIFDKGEAEIKSMAKGLDFEEFLDRDLNDGFSGGEIKRSELLQLTAQDPDFLLLDEPESGVDLENIALIGKVIEELLQRELKPQEGKSRKELKRERWKSGLIITHTGYILDYVDVDRGHVLMEGELACSGNPREILKTIKEQGYEECVNCCRI
ncbi:MAG: ABC transporter ATP-binding protein [Deltaproteobacteria bacterium]|nr:MAG: ABC transporter ATP-binding protein [Deltaproteobacteria bacterium]